MNQYNGGLQSIQESEQEYQDHQSAIIRLSTSNQGSYNFENSQISKILMSKNLNSIQLPSSLYLKNQLQDNQTLYKYNNKQSLLQPLTNLPSQQQISAILQTQSQKNTLPNTIEDLLTVQNGGASKHFFDENSIDLSFINFLNKDDQQNGQQGITNISKVLNTNRQIPNYASVFQSNGQLSSINNLNTSNNLTQQTSALLGVGGIKASQQVQEKYQQGLQNINDLAQLLTSPSYTPDKYIQNKQQESNLVSQNNQNNQQKPISQQYDEIMLKYQSVLQNSKSSKSEENEQDIQRSPFNNQNESIKINDVSECLYPISDYSHSNIGAFNAQQDQNTQGQKIEHRRLSSLEYQIGSNEMNQNKVGDKKRFSPSSRQFTFEQNNELRGSSLSLNRLNNQQINPNQVSDYQYNQKYIAQSTSNLYNQEIIQNSNYAEEATKKSSIQQQINQSNDYQQNNMKNYQNQQSSATKYNLIQMNQNQPNNSNKEDYTNNQFYQNNVSSKSQQYEQILQKYLPKTYNQNSTQQNIYSSQNSQNNSVSSSMISNHGGMQTQSNYQNNDAKSLRDRSNSINKLATARELLENFSVTKKEGSNNNSPQLRQPLGIIQTNLGNSQISERFNTLSSAQKMKDSNMFQHCTAMKESITLQNNNMKDSNGFQHMQFKDSKGFQNQSNYYNSKSITQTQQQITQQNTQQDEGSSIPQYKPHYNSAYKTDLNTFNNSNYNSIISNLTDLKAQPYLSNNLVLGNENISLPQNKRTSFDNKQPLQQVSNGQIPLSIYTSQQNNIQQYPPVSAFNATEASKNIQIDASSQTQFNFNKNIDLAPQTVQLNTQDQFIRTNNHMKSINDSFPQQVSAPLNSNQVTRRQSYQSENRLLNQQQDLITQRKNSVDKPVILDAKSLLFQKEQEIKMQAVQQKDVSYSLQQQQQVPLQQVQVQPLQQFQPAQQDQLLSQQQQLIQQQQLPQPFYQQQSYLQNQSNPKFQQGNQFINQPPQIFQQLQTQQLMNQDKFLLEPNQIQIQNQQQFTYPQIYQSQQVQQPSYASQYQNLPQTQQQQQVLLPQESIQSQAIPSSFYQASLNFHQQQNQPFEAKQTSVEQVEQIYNHQSQYQPTQQQRSNSAQSQLSSGQAKSYQFQTKPNDKLTINTQFNKEIVIPSTISPISTPTNGKKKQSNNIDKEFELEFKDFVLDLQTQNQDQGENKTLKPSQSQPFLSTFYSAQKEQVSNHLNMNDQMIRSQQKPKRKIFEDHFKNQQSHKTLKMNGQMLKNVLGLTKGQKNDNNLSDNQFNLRVKTENNLSANDTDTVQNKDRLSSINPNLNFSRQTMQSILNPYRQTNQTNYLPPKPKYIVPAKDESPIKNYYISSSINNLNQEQRSSQNLDSKDQKHNNEMQNFNIFNNKQTEGSSAFKFNNKNDETSYRPSEIPSQYDKSYRTATLQPSVKQSDEAKDMIRTIKSDEQLEENVKRAQFSKSKSTAKIFGNQNEENRNSSQGVQITSPNPFVTQSSFNALDMGRNQEYKKQSAPSIYKPQQTSNNLNYPQITDKDRKMLQMVEQKMQNQFQDQSVLGIPILCINCDNYYEQKEIENHICIPRDSTQPRKEANQELANPHSQRMYPEQQFATENSLVNDKIKVIFEKISEQQQSNEQEQIKQLIQRVLNLNLNSEGLSKECRTLQHLNKTVENIKSRVGLSLLILSQRAEVLLKDKIDIYRRKEGLNKNTNNASNLFSINHINQMNVLEFNKSSYSSSRGTAFISNQNIENKKMNKNEDLPSEYDVTEINFTQNNKTDRLESNRNTRNTVNTNYEKVNSANILPSNSSPRVNLNTNNNYSTTQKSKIFSTPVTKIFNHSENRNLEQKNQIINYNEKIEIDSNSNYSKRKQAPNNNNNEDAQSQYSTSQMSIESKDLLKKYQQSTSLIKFNESSVQSQQKRQFYNIALNLKLKLPTNHPARDCIISEMYTQAEKQNVPETNYQKYIENYFKQFKN